MASLCQMRMEVRILLHGLNERRLMARFSSVCLRRDVFSRKGPAGKADAGLAEFDTVWRIIVDGTEDNIGGAVPKRAITTQQKFHIRHGITGEYLSLAPIKFALPTFADDSIHKHAEEDGSAETASTENGGAEERAAERIFGKVGVSSPKEERKYEFLIGRRQLKATPTEKEEPKDEEKEKEADNGKKGDEGKDSLTTSGAHLIAADELSSSKTIVEPKPETYELILVAEPGENTLFALRQNTEAFEVHLLFFSQ